MRIGTREGSEEWVKVKLPDGFGVLEGKCAASSAFITLFNEAPTASPVTFNDSGAIGPQTTDGGAFAARKVIVNCSVAVLEIPESLAAGLDVVPAPLSFEPLEGDFTADVWTAAVGTEFSEAVPGGAPLASEVSGSMVSTVEVKPSKMELIWDSGE
jgi:hypothetical protein